MYDQNMFVNDNRDEVNQEEENIIDKKIEEGLKKKYGVEINESWGFR